jgi:hypothetical protein
MDNKQDITYHILNYNTERHIQCRPPEEAYRFIPNDSQIVELDKRQDHTLRRIFEAKQAYLTYEEEQLEILDIAIKEFNKNKGNKRDFISINLPSTWKKYDSLRFLQATMYKADKTINILLQHFEWRKSYFPFTITNKAMEILNSGFIYVHGRDSLYRPIMIINAKFYVDNMNKYTYEDFLCCVIYFIEYMINNLLIPGQVENWIIITDLNGVSLLGIPKDMKSMMGVLGANYRCRLFINYILGMGTVLNFLWNIVKKFLDEVQLKKIKFLKKGEFGPIFDYINEEQVEERFGGKAKNLTEGFFPPVMPSKNYNKSGAGLVSEEEYDKLVKDDKITKISPYYLKKKEEERISIQNKIASLKIEELNKIKDYEIFVGDTLDSIRNEGKRDVRLGNI